MQSQHPDARDRYGGAVSLTHDLIMMGPLGTPLELLSDAVSVDGWFELEGVQWTVERIPGGRRVYTFALDDVWDSTTTTKTEEPTR